MFEYYSSINGPDVRSYTQDFEKALLSLPESHLVNSVLNARLIRPREVFTIIIVM